MRASSILAACLAVVLSGCSSVAHIATAKTEIRGRTVHQDGSPAPDVHLRVNGVHTGYLVIIPVPNALRLLREMKSDSEGRFSCTVPAYDEYYLEPNTDFVMGVSTKREFLEKHEVVIKIR
jgi:hypothetical protein